ncbi:MAG: DHCW motif cupin fold protein [Nannocystaceae bacterium]
MTRTPMALGEAFVAVDWSSRPATEIVGAKGRALERSTSIGTLRVRLIEFSAGYEADHWCRRGHVGYVVEGELTLRIDDGRRFELSKGDSFMVGDEIDAHLLETAQGTTVFLVD